MPSAATSTRLTYPQQAVLAPVNPRDQVATHLGQIKPENRYSPQNRYDLEAQQSSMNTPATRQQRPIYLDTNIVQNNRLRPWAMKGLKVFGFFAIPGAIAIIIVACYLGLNKNTNYKSH